jgi:UDP-N-acetylmuramoylalanine--D-glutamate ligase
MTSEDLKNKRIGIVGAGVEGKAVAAFLEKHGLAFEVFDKSTDPQYLEKASECEILFRSPGVKILEPVLVEAAKKGVKITSQIKFFMENCPAKIIGVTGSKGKGTTSQLIYNILQAAGMNSYLAGNIGVPAIDLLEKLKEDDYVVLELSSFQLQDLNTSPHIAVVLMVIPEHFDYHTGMEEYVEAKSSIVRFQTNTDFAVINSDYEPSMKIGKLGDASKSYIQTVPADKVETDPFDIYKPEEFLNIKNGVFAEELHGGVYLVSKGQLTKFMDLAGTQLRGFHNAENICAALMVAKLLNIKDSTIIETIQNYKGLEHRLEFVVETNRIKFYNDSIGTTPQSSIAAIKAFKEPEIVIIGGADKKVDYEDFAKELCKQKNLKAVILIGAIADTLAEYLKASGYTGRILISAKDMPEVFAQIKEVAEEGDVVLLAPGTSSFGMFKDYKDRGNQFKKLALEFK